MEEQVEVRATNTFSLNLYQNSAEPSRVNKTNYLKYIGVIQGVLREECPIVAPTILIEYNKFPDFNYVSILAFNNRYYYVKNITSVKENLWEIELNVDVLMSYATAILNLKAFVERNENTYDDLIIDTKRVIQQGVDVEVLEVKNDVFMTTNDKEVIGDFMLIGYQLGEETGG